MRILAINDAIGSSIGIFENGVPQFCIEEERFTRVKNEMGFPENALQYALEKELITPESVDCVALTNDHFMEFTRKGFYDTYDKMFDQALSTNPVQSAKNKAENVARFTLRSNPYLYEKYKEFKVNKSGERDVDKLIALGFKKESIRRVNHHHCHGSAVYYGLAPKLDEKYLIFTLDGGGDRITSSISIGENGDLKRVDESTCFSIGNIYSNVTYFLGFTPHEHEYKLMGLAPYPNQKYTKKYKDYFSKYLVLKNDDTEFENPITINHETLFKHLLNDLRRDRFDNIAAGLQAFCEDIVTRWIVGNVKKYGFKKILCSGGVFMNVKMNKLISQLPEVEFVDVFPSCGDETNIFGAAFHVQNTEAEKKVSLLKKFTLGTTPSGDLESALEKYKNEITWEKVLDPNQYIADQLLENKIVARCSGEMEFGARALGNRSILGNPSDLMTVNKINQAIKKRDFWMPFAPALMWDKANEVIDIPESLKEQGSPYMMFAFDSKPGMETKIACGIHQADFTARAETITKERYPDFYEIIDKFYQKSGIPVVLNTSFNLHGYPIVENSEQAIYVLTHSKLDMLVIDDVVIRRKDD